MKQLIELKVNGEIYEVSVDPRRTLSEVLREQLGLTGTKESCAMGECGACTVIINGLPRLACITMAMEMQDKDILTVEVLVRDGKPHPLQIAFANFDGAQCGFCTPGIIMSAKALLDHNPDPTPEEVKRALSGNLCRCTGYKKIVYPVLQAAAMVREQVLEVS